MHVAIDTGCKRVEVASYGKRLEKTRVSV